MEGEGSVDEFDSLDEKNGIHRFVNIGEPENSIVVKIHCDPDFSGSGTHLLDLMY